MKFFRSFLKFTTLIFFFCTPLISASTENIEPIYDKVYRTDKVADAYHFFLISKNGKYYYVHTNKAKRLTPSELKSPNLVDILNKKQSWGKVFLSSGEYTKKDERFYTKRYWDHIKLFNSKKIKYLNKSFHLQ